MNGCCPCVSGWAVAATVAQGSRPLAGFRDKLSWARRRAGHPEWGLRGGCSLGDHESAPSRAGVLPTPAGRAQVLPAAEEAVRRSPWLGVAGGSGHRFVNQGGLPRKFV